MRDAVILAEGVFGTTYGKTANGLIRYSKRYAIRSVIDSILEGKDAGEIISGTRNGIPVVGSMKDLDGISADTLIIGAATHGGYIPENFRKAILDAIEKGYAVVSGLHEFLSDDPEFIAAASRNNVELTDVRKMFSSRKDFFTGRINEVEATKIAVLGTDSAIGKRTTTIRLNEATNSSGIRSTVVGTGQTSWMQGIEHTIVLDAIVNDFVPGALETVTCEAWEDGNPDYIFIEGQGSVMHPAFPGGFEIIGACRPDAIVLQHAPMRREYDGFPGFRIPKLEDYIRILELLSGKKVIAISLNTENMTEEDVDVYISETEDQFGIPVFNPLSNLHNTASMILESASK